MRSASMTSVRVILYWVSFAGSMSTCISFAPPPLKVISETPFTRPSGSTICVSRKFPRPSRSTVCPGLATSARRAIGLSSEFEVRTSGVRASDGRPVTADSLLRSSTSALSISCVTVYVSVTDARPRRDADTSSSTPLRPDNSDSSRPTISRSTSSGEAPGQLTRTSRIGFSISGLIWIGMLRSATTPKSTVSRISARTATGRSMASLITAPISRRSSCQ